MCEPLAALSQIQGFLPQGASGEFCMSGKNTCTCSLRVFLNNKPCLLENCFCGNLCSFWEKKNNKKTLIKIFCWLWQQVTRLFTFVFFTKEHHFLTWMTAKCKLLLSSLLLLSAQSGYMLLFANSTVLGALKIKTVLVTLELAYNTIWPCDKS